MSSSMEISVDYSTAPGPKWGHRQQTVHNKIIITRYHDISHIDSWYENKLTISLTADRCQQWLQWVPTNTFTTAVDTRMASETAADTVSQSGAESVSKTGADILPAPVLLTVSASEWPTVSGPDWWRQSTGQHDWYTECCQHCQQGYWVWPSKTVS